MEDASTLGVTNFFIKLIESIDKSNCNPEYNVKVPKLGWGDAQL